MKIKNEKGVSGIEVAIVVVLIFIFVSVIASLIYRINSKSNEIELKSEATSIAVDEIELIKNTDFSEFEELNKTSTTDKNGNSLVNQPTSKEGFYKTIIVKDYTDIEGNEDKISDLVKKVTVKISYMFKSKEQSVELSTLLLKEK